MPFAFTPRLTSIIRGFAGVLAVLLLVAACSDDDFGYQERSVEELYNNAMDELLDGSYVEAAQGFDEVERQHPYSVWATKAQLMNPFEHLEAALEAKQLCLLQYTWFRSGAWAIFSLD